MFAVAGRDTDPAMYPRPLTGTEFLGDELPASSQGAGGGGTGPPAGPPASADAGATGGATASADAGADEGEAEGVYIRAGSGRVVWFTGLAPEEPMTTRPGNRSRSR